MKKSAKLLTLATVVAFVVLACKTNDPVTPTESTVYVPPADKVTAMPASTQRTGDAKKGYDYLVNGDYVNSGIAVDVASKFNFLNSSNELGRTGVAATVPYNYNLATAENGVQVIAPNCLQCHAQVVDNQLFVGLGNTVLDYTGGQPYGSLVQLANIYLQQQGGAGYDAFKPVYDAVTATGTYLKTEVVGANPAMKLAAVLGAYRNKNSLVWLTNPQFVIPQEVYPTDVPAWWILKKKNAMFHAGWGRGDFSRIMMASGLLTLKDSSQARKIDNHFPDVYAYIKSITPPKYKQTIDQSLVITGQKVFTNKCAGCHGTYETGNITYPNYLVSNDLVGADAYLLNDFSTKDTYINWYNTGWFGTTKPTASFTTTKGYIAPPLDGVWATAPYLHNGSVPTLEDLLNSSQRPKYWRKIIANNAVKVDAYDYSKVGWQYTKETAKTDKFTYDTTLPGYGNQGHIFGDGISTTDRKALIEYLKTL